MAGFSWNYREHLHLLRYALRWVVLAGAAAALIGSACAGFLWALERATVAQWQHPWLVWLLPVAGVPIVLVYRLYGRGSDGGNNLIMDEIHAPGGGVPLRMAPLVLVATVVTHLFGGSAGREGTAVQIGGSVAYNVARRLRLGATDVRTLLRVGMAAGFGGVFGTPLAGALFALEVVAIGRISYAALFPCLVAGVVGDWACRVWGIHHTAYRVAVTPMAFDWMTAGKIALAAVAFGLASVAFAEMTHGLTTLWKKLIRRDWLRPVAGGLVVIGLTFALGSRDYLGLGVAPPPGGHVSIVTAFSPGGSDGLSFAWKIIFTAVTLSCGFKGGEVTPLFFIGATLGNTLAWLLHAPTDLFAALGFVAVFAGATNTPLACTIMAVELFGGGHVVYYAIACFVAYLFSGHSGVYLSQRLGVGKGELIDGEGETTLRDRRRK